MTDSDSRQHFFADMTFREADLSEVRRQRSTRILRYALWTAALSAAMFALLFAFTGNGKRGRGRFSSASPKTNRTRAH